MAALGQTLPIGCRACRSLRQRPASPVTLDAVPGTPEPSSFLHGLLMPHVVLAVFLASMVQGSPSLHGKGLSNSDKAVTRAKIWLAKKRSVPFDLAVTGTPYDLQSEDSM